MKPNISLLGFMGTGKSTVARCLAAELGWVVVDTDARIEAQTGRPVDRIWQEKGEGFFRSLEAKVVAEVTSLSHVVLSCGGGVVLEPDNISLLKRNSIVFVLEASPEIILSRIDNDSQLRPLLLSGDRLMRIRELLCSRADLYARAADNVIDTTCLSVAQVVSRILNEVGR